MIILRPFPSSAPSPGNAGGVVCVYLFACLLEGCVNGWIEEWTFVCLLYICMWVGVLVCMYLCMCVCVYMIVWMFVYLLTCLFQWNRLITILRVIDFFILSTPFKSIERNIWVCVYSLSHNFKVEYNWHYHSNSIVTFIVNYLKVLTSLQPIMISIFPVKKS